jgi:hypothetical protein
MMTVADRSGEALRRFRNRIGRCYAQRIEPLGAGKILDQAAKPRRRQKSRLA